MDLLEELEEELTAKQVRLCQEFMVDLNGQEAAIRAGYEPENAKVIASQTFAKPYVKAYLRELKNQTAKVLQISREKVLTTLSAMAFFDPANFYDENGNLKPIQDLDNETAKALTSFEVYSENENIEGSELKLITSMTSKIRLCDRRAALDMISKILGYYAPIKIASTDPKGNAIKPASIYIMPPGTDNLEIKEAE
jgi:phage terminase small subunit